MAETAITAALSKFGELATREAAVLLQVGDDMMLLRDRLEWLQASIRDGDRKRRAGTDGLTRVWLRQTRDAAFEAEDALDDFFQKVDQENQDDQSWKTWHRYMAGWMSRVTMRHQLSGRITRIKSRLDQISESQKEYNIEHTPLRIWTSSATALAPWDDSRRMLIGSEKDKKHLCSLLEKGSHDQKMYISVLGKSGSGKKTLVDSVYHDYEMSKEKRFDVLVRYNMPPDSTARDVLKEIRKRVVKQDMRSNDVAGELRDLLGREKYLVVLSGISSEAMLNCIGASLPDVNNGSRVVLILESDAQGDELARHAEGLNRNRNNIHAQGDELARHAEGLNRNRNNILRMGRWDKKRSWELFHSRVLGAQAQEEAEDLNRKRNAAPCMPWAWIIFRGLGEEDKERSEYEEKVHAMTGGHPLTLVVLAGLLRHKEEPNEWKTLIEQLLNPRAASEGEKLLDLEEDVAKRLAQHASMDLAQLASPQVAATATASPPKSTRMAMQMVFSASYDDLPQELKLCLLYFAAYPKNISVSAESMLRMWTAEGFIKPQKGKTLEELGHMHLRELVSRYLVQKKVYDGIEYSVHSCLLEFLQTEARHASFMEVHDKNDVLAPASVRRLSIQNDGNGYTTFTNKFPKLRSFICRVEDDATSSSSSVLSCACPCPAREGHRHDINFLRGSKLLRLISVVGLSLAKLPSGIGEMIHLRYLRVDSRCLLELPSSISRLLNLQTLDIRETEVEKINPKFWTIKALRHVLAKKLKLPVSPLVKELGELQTLHGVCAPDEGWEKGNCPLDKMTKLRSLEMDRFIANKHEDAFKSALTNMHLLGCLKLKGDTVPCGWLLTEPSLLYLQSMVLDGDIILTRPRIIADDVRNDRPNLTLLKLKTGSINELRKIKDELKKIPSIEIEHIDVSSSTSSFSYL